MPSVRILALDAGAGTQDIWLYDAQQTPENCPKLVLPAQTQVVAARIRAVTARGRPLFLYGTVMGGGASSEAILAHRAAGLPVYATAAAARTLHNDLERVRAMGIQLVEAPPPDADAVWLGDVDLPALRHALAAFEVTVPSIVAIAVQDHGYAPGRDTHDTRYAFLQRLLAAGGDPYQMAFRTPPPGMLRMHAVAQLIPGAVIMDTGAAAVLGCLCDPLVAAAAAEDGAVLVNIGNMHTFAIALRRGTVYGLFEHHTGGITADLLNGLVERLQHGQLTHEDVIAGGGHGAAFHPAYRTAGSFPFVAITGPNRHLARGLGYYEAAPFGDMMLTGAFGLVEATLRLLEREYGLTGLPRLTVH
ncbi:MAG: DUF1786 domain-containing protein [Thermorudis peleae]|nr:DUF1786 domain-containing protein [Thermorudis peleae]